MENFIGELLALGAALCFSLASTTFTLAGRKFGANASMALSLVISLLFLLPLHQLTLGEVFPFSASLSRWLILGLSSLAGFVISALFLLRAFQVIGPRVTLLIGSASPIVAALMAWVFLGEALTAYATIGIALVLSGVITVVSDNKNNAFNHATTSYGKGILMAVAAAFSQGASYVLMSEGVADGFPAMSASIMRTVVGIVVLVALIALRGKLRENFGLLVSETRALSLLLLASLSGPVIGTTLVLMSLQFNQCRYLSNLDRHDTNPLDPGRFSSLRRTRQRARGDRHTRRDLWRGFALRCLMPIDGERRR